MTLTLLLQHCKKTLVEHKYAVLTLILLVLLFNSITSNQLFWSSFQDSGHAVVFGLASYLLVEFLLSYRGDSQDLRIIMIGAMSVFSAGLLVELLQPYFGRSRSLLDVWYDLIGCVAAGLFCYQKRVYQSPGTKRYARMLTVLAVLLLLSSLLWPLHKLMIVWQRFLAVPQLIGFDAQWEEGLWQVNLGAALVVVPAPTAWTTNLSRVGKIHFRHELYPGITWSHLYPDWSNYRTLCLDIFSEQTNDLALHVRIHDDNHNNDYHDRFNRKLRIKLGLNRVCIDLDEVKTAPKSRLLRLDRVAALILFMISPKQEAVIYVDNIRLE